MLSGGSILFVAPVPYGFLAVTRDWGYLSFYPEKFYVRT
jgi:hypothetical protein